MHHLHQQTHVAQQSRREKLRVVGAAPPASSQSDLSAGSAKVIKVSQSASAGSQKAYNSDQFELSSISLREYDGLSHHSSVNDILPLQKTNMMTSDQYNFPTGAELLAAPSKGNGYTSASGDIGSLSSPLVGTLISGQALTSAAFSNQTSLLPKAGSWNNHYPQLGQYSSNPLSSNPYSLQGLPANTSSACLQNAVEATVLLGNYGSNSKDNIMASLFSGANAQADAMQFLLMNGGYNPYSDASIPANVVLFGPSTGITAQGSHLLNGGQSQPHYIGIPFPSSALSPGSLSPHSSLTSVVDPTMSNPCPSSGFSTTRTNNPNNNWKNEELMFTSAGDAALQMRLISTPETHCLNSDHVTMQNISESGIKPSNLVSIPSNSQSLLQVGSSNRYQVESTRAGSSTYGQSLNLSLSSQRPSGIQLHSFDVEFQSNIDHTETASQLEAKNMGQTTNKVNGELSRFRTSTSDLVSETEFPHVPRLTHTDSNSSVVAGSFNFLSSSKYLKATQQLLDEVCIVGREMRKSAHRRQRSHAWPCPNSTDMVSTSRDSSALQECSNKDEARLGPAVPSMPVNDCKEPAGTSLSLEERHECEMKKAKLLHMLQEVEKRYRQYNDQMQILINSFDSIAGVGSATPYTALALQAMSRYFRCLKDAICGQIQVACKALGEDDITKYITNKGNHSKQRYMDQQLRQQRALQQFGMLQQHAWRPQRGLPERSVSILRAWLFEHFLHPYPKDADKMMLARQTGLTRSQVSNWFINARVRLWKPMVEEMYQEESRDQEVEVSVHLTEEVHGSMNYEEGRVEVGASEKYCKVDSNLDQSYTNVALVEGNTQGALEHQNFMEGNMVTSDFLPANILSMRKQVGTMVDVSGVHMLEDGQKERLGLIQNKKSKVNIHEPDTLHSTMHMEVDMKSDGTSSNVIDETDQKLGMAGLRNPIEQYSFSVNESIHPDVGCFGAYGQGNLSRYESGGALDARCPGNGVSLTLGLRHCDSLPVAQQTYLHGAQNITVESRQNIGNNNHEYSGFYEVPGKLNSDRMNDPRSSSYQSRKHIESHLLHDFVIS